MAITVEGPVAQRRIGVRKEITTQDRFLEADYELVWKVNGIANASIAVLVAPQPLPAFDDAVPWAAFDATGFLDDVVCVGLNSTSADEYGLDTGQDEACCYIAARYRYIPIYQWSRLNFGVEAVNIRFPMEADGSGPVEGQPPLARGAGASVEVGVLDVQLYQHYLGSPPSAMFNLALELQASPSTAVNSDSIVLPRLNQVDGDDLQVAAGDLRYRGYEETRMDNGIIRVVHSFALRPGGHKFLDEPIAEGEEDIAPAAYRASDVYPEREFAPLIDFGENTP